MLQFSSRRRFDDLSEREILALAISSEEDDARIYRMFGERLRDGYPATAALFDDMAVEEDEHRRRLIEMHAARFGDVIPLIRREHVAGFYSRRPVWLTENLPLETIRAEAPGVYEQIDGGAALSDEPKETLKSVNERFARNFQPTNEEHVVREPEAKPLDEADVSKNQLNVSRKSQKQS